MYTWGRAAAKQNSTGLYRYTSGSGSFRPWVVSAESFRLGVGRFGLGRWVISALGRFGPESFRPNFNLVGYISIG